MWVLEAERVGSHFPLTAVIDTLRDRHRDAWKFRFVLLFPEEMDGGASEFSVTLHLSCYVQLLFPSASATDQQQPDWEEATFCWLLHHFSLQSYTMGWTQFQISLQDPPCPPVPLLKGGHGNFPLILQLPSETYFPHFLPKLYKLYLLQEILHFNLLSWFTLTNTEKLSVHGT